MFDLTGYEKQNRLEIMSALKERILKAQTSTAELGSLLNQWELQLHKLKQVEAETTRVQIGGLEFDFEQEKRRILELNAQNPL